MPRDSWLTQESGPRASAPHCVLLACLLSHQGVSPQCTQRSSGAFFFFLTPLWYRVGWRHHRSCGCFCQFWGLLKDGFSSDGRFCVPLFLRR